MSVKTMQFSKTVPNNSMLNLFALYKQANLGDKSSKQCVHKNRPPTWAPCFLRASGDRRTPTPLARGSWRWFVQLTQRRPLPCHCVASSVAMLGRLGLA